MQSNQHLPQGETPRPFLLAPMPLESELGDLACMASPMCPGRRVREHRGDTPSPGTPGCHPAPSSVQRARDPSCRRSLPFSASGLRGEGNAHPVLKTRQGRNCVSNARPRFLGWQKAHAFGQTARLCKAPRAEKCSTMQCRTSVSLIQDRVKVIVRNHEVISHT